MWLYVLAKAVCMFLFFIWYILPKKLLIFFLSRVTLKSVLS